MLKEIINNTNGVCMDKFIIKGVLTLLFILCSYVQALEWDITGLLDFRYTITDGIDNNNEDGDAITLNYTYQLTKNWFTTQWIGTYW